MSRTGWMWAVALTAMCVIPRPAAAQQAVTVSFGYLGVRGEDARVSDDVLVANRDILAFDVRDFDRGSIGAEWTLPFGDYVEASVGAAFSTRRVPTVYADFVNRDGTEIEQDVLLRIVPVTAVVRVLPFGRSRALQPYIGGGIGAVSYRYSEVGDFVDFTDNSVFRDRFSASGTVVGPVVVGGLRVPVGDAWAVGGEVRYHAATANLSTEFLGSKLDLGGVQFLGTIRVSF